MKRITLFLWLMMPFTLLSQEFDVFDTQYLIKSAEEGNVAAQLFLGVCYESGLKLEKSYEKAAYWYEKAAIQNHPKAQ